MLLPLHKMGTPKNSHYRQRRLVMLAAAFAILLIGLCCVRFSASHQSASARGVFGGPDKAPPATPPPDCPASWNIVSSPNPGSSYNHLFGIAAISPTDVWAVGYYSLGSRGVTLTMHWDGSQWTYIPSPSPGATTDILLDVQAIAPNDVLAVGYTYGGYGGRQLTLVEHWNGTSWNLVPSPNPQSSVDNDLKGVSPISPNDIWVVGHSLEDIGGFGYYRTLTEHWDGTQWTIVPSPNIGSNHNELLDVAAIAPNDVWGVGYGSGGAMIIHWDGVQWSVVPNPNPPGTHPSNLLGISALSTNDVWAVGRWGDGARDHTLIKHWDGVQWSVVPSPDQNTQDNNWLYSVSAISPTDAWAVGYYCCGDDGWVKGLIEHWDGTQWSIVPSPNPPSGGIEYLEAVSATSNSDAWAVGYYGGGIWRTLTKHYAPPSVCLTPTTTPTSTITPTPSATPTPNAPPILIGHVNWEARPTQPSQLQQLPITLTLRLGTTEIDYSNQHTDRYGFFTVTLGNLPTGTYTWRADDYTSTLHSPNYLANSGQVHIAIGGAPTISVEIGLMRAGDADDNNRVNIADFNVLKVSFGFGCGNPAYDRRTDFTGDCLINIADFSALRRNFGQSGAPPIGPVQVQGRHKGRT